MTTIKNEAIKYQYPRTTVIRGADNNNASEIDYQFTFIDPMYRREENKFNQFVNLIEILWKGASSNMAFDMERNRQYNRRDDVSMELILEAVEKLSNDKGIQEEMVNILKQGKLLPKYPVKMNNYHFEEFEITDTNGRTIYYNVYTACPHNALGDETICKECEYLSMKQRNYMQNMMRNLHCE